MTVLIQDLLHTPAQFRRSAHLQRDFAEPHALDHYVLSDELTSALDRVTAGLQRRPAARAWRFTGDYGTGKSSFALLLARKLAVGALPLPSHLSGLPTLPSESRLLPVLVEGQRAGLGPAVTTAVRRALKDAGAGRRLSKTPLAAQLAAGLDDHQLVEFMTSLATQVRAKNIASGVLLIVDELGKFLEHLALHPGRQDIFVLQQLAEAAARSADAPFFVIGLLHQGIHAYAARLPDAARPEWEKVAGRFEEIVFTQPIDHALALTTSALGIDTNGLPKHVVSQSRKLFKQTAALGWYGRTDRPQMKHADGSLLYPLHPTVLPVLTRVLTRFGQHHRSLFEFLLSNEPHSLQPWGARPVQDWYRLNDLYDYVRSSFGSRLGADSYRNHWVRITEMVDGATGELPNTVKILKTVALLNTLDADDLRPTADLLAIAVGAPRKVLHAELERLRARGRLFLRGTDVGYSLWPAGTVSVDAAVAEARAVHHAPQSVARALSAQLGESAVVARRHFVQSGTMRHFAVRHVSADAGLDDAVRHPTDADGLIAIILCDTDADREVTTRWAQSSSIAVRDDLIVGVSHPVEALAEAITEVTRWEWIQRHKLELSQDRYAANEVARQVRLAHEHRDRLVAETVGLGTTIDAARLSWYARGEMLALSSHRSLLEQVSATCDALYPDAPRVTNELVNRRELSAAAAKARAILVDHLLESSHLPELGLDTSATPPERCIYLSVIRGGGFHEKRDGRWVLQRPSVDADTQHILPALRAIENALLAADGGRVGLPTLLRQLSSRPLGVRDGLSPILIALFAALHHRDLAIYENGTFCTSPGGHEFTRMNKAPAAFELQLCPVAETGVALLAELAALLRAMELEERAPEVVDVVTGLCTFVANLPAWVLNTRRLNPVTLAIRDSLLNAREPTPLVFSILPEACGLPPIDPGSTDDTDTPALFVEKLGDSLRELGAAYPALQTRIENRLFDQLMPKTDAATARSELTRRARQLLQRVRDPQLRAFCGRLADDKLPRPAWLDALGSAICAKPPRDWRDADDDSFSERLGELCDHFKNVEGMGFGMDGAVEETTFRVAVTRHDGRQVDRIVRMNEQQAEAMRRLDGELDAALAKHDGDASVTAAARLLWRVLADGRDRVD